MADYTDHYGLSRLNGQNGALSDDGYKHTYADREVIDHYLYMGAEGHHHTGAAGVIEEPDTSPELSLSVTGGTIPSGTRVYYKYTYVKDTGEESAASPEAFVDTPDPIEAPSAPTLTYTQTGGVLQGGNYYYVLTSYVDASIQETKALNPVFITIPSTTATNEITLELPEPADGQTGFNIYRRKPGQTKYFFLDSVETEVATPPTEYVDDGSVTADPDRTLPKLNTTNSTNSIDITLPGATPAVPDGYTWKIYRTYLTAIWDTSFLVHVVENVSEGDPAITPTYLDIGISTQGGTFPASSIVANSPTKVLLTDGAEVQGTLPMGLVSGYPYALTFQYPGILTEGPGETQWPSPFEKAMVVHALAALARESTPAAQDVIADVLIGRGSATPTMESVYVAEADMVKVAVGQETSLAPAPATVPLADRIVLLGETVSTDLIQVGEGATPTDEELTITVLLYVFVGETDTSLVWPE